MCQLFQMSDRVEDWERKKGSLFSHDEHLGSMLFELCSVKVNLVSAIFINQALLILIST